VTGGTFDSPMATTDGTDARLLAGAFALSAVVLAVVGMSAIPEAPFEWTGTALIPLLLAAAGFMVMMLVVDPVLTPKQRPTRDEVHIWLSKTFMTRLPAVEVPVLVGLLIAVIEKERSVLLLGALGSLALSTVWWPGEQFFNAMRRRLQPLSADNLLDELLNKSNGRLLLRSR
jgi:hypothetical protein